MFTTLLVILSKLVPKVTAKTRKCPPGKYTMIAGSSTALPKCETCAPGFFKSSFSISANCSGAPTRTGRSYFSQDFPAKDDLYVIRCVGMMLRVMLDPTVSVCIIPIHLMDFKGYLLVPFPVN